MNFLRNILSVEPPPTKVIEVRPDQYTSRTIHIRDDGIILYEPSSNQRQREKYEIVLHRPCTESLHMAYSLFRSLRQDEAEQRFFCFKDKIPALIEISKDVCNLRSLQNLCDILSEHPSWNLAHLAAHFALFEALNHPSVNCFLNSSDSSTGMSPLQVAVKTNNLRLIQQMLAAKCSLEHLDHSGNTVFHYAASSTKEIISALISENPPTCLNSRNKDGYTPLHMACLADKPDCVKALLLAGADVNISAAKVSPNNEPESAPGYVGNFIQASQNKLFTDDMKHGGTPLHWSLSREVIETLVDMGCNINALNFDGRTALHIMVMRNRLDCAVALLSREADPNIADVDGNTALHLAVQCNCIPIVQALIVFGADLNYKNNVGASPRHLVLLDDSNSDANRILYLLHSVGAERCTQDVIGCTSGCKFGETFDGSPPPPVNAQYSRDILDQMLDHAGQDVRSENGKQIKGGRLLCLDGGGIRGLVLVQLLIEIEHHLNKPIQHCFDWIAGTSTGGILALGLCTGKTLKECLCLYFRMKEYAFIGKRPYASEALENILKESLGTETVMADIKNPKLMITGVLADRKPVDLHLFRNYPSPESLVGLEPNGPFVAPPPPEEQLLWQAARATGAAPSYFRAYGRFLDGGLIANNPTLDAMTEIHEYNLALTSVGRKNETTPLSIVVSLGTGLIPLTQYKEIDVFRPESILDTAKLAMGVSTIGYLLVDQATCSDGRVVDRARAWCSMIGVPYFRFSPQMSEDIIMDEKSDLKLVNLLWEAKAFMYANKPKIKKMVSLITDQ